MPNKLTHKEFVKRVSGRPVKVLGRYVGNKDKILIKCNECNHEWKSRPDHIAEGKGCPACARARITKTHEQFLKEIEGRTLTPLTRYKTREAGIKMACDDCGYTWDTTPENILAMSGCIVCVLRSKRTPPEVVEDHGDWVVVKSSGDGSRVMVDTSDLHLVDGAVWCRNGYASLRKYGKDIKIHHLIMPQKDGLEIDHIDRNPSNNRRSNLRYATRSQNAMNRGIQSNSSTGITGVFYEKKTNKWQAHITIRRKRMHLGSFGNVDSAVEARNKGEEEFFGEFAPQR